MPAGIVSFGGCVPLKRMSRDMLAQAWGGRSNGGGKAVANHDEDAITLSVAAARDVMGGRDPASIDAYYFASTTSPYAEKASSTVAALALQLRRDVETADFGGTLRCGSGALKAALRAVDAGAATHVLVTVADCRMGAPETVDEQNLADGAAAFVIGSEKVVAKVLAEASVADETIDTWRRRDDAFVVSWEDRFIKKHGYQDQMVEVIKAVLAKAGLKPDRVAKVVAYGPDTRSHIAMARAVGFDAKTQLYDGGLFHAAGNSGSAFASRRTPARRRS